ncbi:unnamed protein product [Adineta ricciae]|nr:unnamed protein product [Adineta ricciae]
MAKNVLERFAPQHAGRIIENFAPSEKMVKVIESFDALPTVSIDEAVDPLVSLIPDVKKMVAKVQEKCKSPKDGLTSDESASIMLYSLEWDPRETSFYIILNNTLRTEDQEQLKPWNLYLKLFICALEKLPPVSKTIYRGVKMDLSAQYPKDKVFVWWAFSSCTSSIQVLQSEQFLGKTGTRTLFNIDCSSGKDIREHSFFPTEDEVLLIAARKFQVVSCLDSGNELFIIQVKEVETDEPLLGPSKKKDSATRSAPRLPTHDREENTSNTPKQAPPRFPGPPPSIPRPKNPFSH